MALTHSEQNPFEQLPADLQEVALRDAVLLPVAQQRVHEAAQPAGVES